MARSLYATLVGIDDYLGNVPPLHGCVNDIEAMQSLLGELAKAGGFTFEARSLKNDRATRANVIAGFSEHLSKATAEDVALFYYCGHGSQQKAPPEMWHLEADRLNETLVCHDSRTEGQWDLADKELAALISQVAARGAHVVCILDCCHSGNGTRATLEEGLSIRRAPTDWRMRSTRDFLDGSLTSNVGLRSAGDAPSAANWLVMPSGRHVLLAACQSSETAKEVNESGKAHGAFSAALLSALRQARGSISYRDLMKRAEAQVRLRVAQQVPQMEANDPSDLLQPFLGGAIALGPISFTLRHDRKLQWVVDGGAVHGIAGPTGSETTVFAIYSLEASVDDRRTLSAAIATAEVIEVRPELSCVNLKASGSDLDPNLTYRAIGIATPLPANQVYLEGEPKALALLRHALVNANGRGRPSFLVREAEAEIDADFRVTAGTTAFRLSRASAERPLVSEIEGIDENGARLAVERLEHVARWQAVAGLNNSISQLGGEPVKISISRADAGGWNEIDTGHDIRLHYHKSGEEWEPPRLRIKLVNDSEVALYCALLWLGESYSISSALFAEAAVLIPPKSSVAVHGGQDIYAMVPDEKWHSGQTELTDRLKLIASRERFDATLFEQGQLDHYRRTRSANSVAPQSTLERLANRVHFRDLVPYRPSQKDVLGDWTTRDLALTVVRPLKAAEIPPSGGSLELGTGVSLSGHSAFKAKVCLGSVGETGRALGSHEVPAIFRDDPELSQPFLFQTARGSDPGLGVLQFTDMSDAESVTLENPLVVRISATLSPGEHVVPYAWDGEFYLPLGAARAVGDAVEVEIRQIPRPLSTTEDVERGIVSSVRILFQKLASPYLGTRFDYPHLAAVSYGSDDQPCYETSIDAVKARVAAANRILLYVHGILGDTVGMAAAAKIREGSPANPASISDHYDLVLAFDYENINTSIKENARALKQRLASVGLGAGHDKVLHIVAHSMGGLLSRWFIEQEEGARVVQRLITLGTPHAGSPWPTIENWATAALAIGLNGLSNVAWPLKLIGDLAGAIETVDVSLDEMASNSEFLSELERSDDPKVPYTLLVGNTSILPEAVASGTLQSLLARLAPQRVLHDVAALAFLKRPNDIAVAVTSASAVPSSRVPPPKISEVACDHITFFTSDAGQHALLNVLKQQ